MQDKDTVISLRCSIEQWRQEAEHKIAAAIESKKTADEWLPHFEAAVQSLPSRPCIFCGGMMIDTSPLKSMADQLSRADFFLNQGEKFCLQCDSCRTYQTHEPLPTSDQWTRSDIDAKSTNFAGMILDRFESVEIVALEKMAGRGWMFFWDGSWFANRAAKDELMKVLGLVKSRPRK